MAEVVHKTSTSAVDAGYGGGRSLDGVVKRIRKERRDVTQPNINLGKLGVP